MTDLRALLGGKYDDALERATSAGPAYLKLVHDSTRRTIAEAALAAVLPDLLADAWDEGHDDGLHNAHEYREHRKMPNPYRPETATTEATGAPETPAGPDAINPPPDPSAAVTEPHNTERTTR